MLTIVEGWRTGHVVADCRVYPPKTKMVRMCQMMQAASAGPWVSSVPNILAVPLVVCLLHLEAAQVPRQRGLCLRCFHIPATDSFWGFDMTLHA